MTEQHFDIDHLYTELGEEPLRAVIAAFYRRVRQDDILAPMYPHDDWEGAEYRLFSFLRFRFGGPQDYIQERGHPRLRMRHMPFVIDHNARDRWLSLMTAAMQECALPTPAQSALYAFFAQVAEAMHNTETAPIQN
jgi:hemoglobin